MRKPISIALVLMLVMPLASLTAQEPKGEMEIRLFSDGRDKAEVIIDDSGMNDTLSVSIPLNGIVTQADANLEALESRVTQDLELSDNATFLEHKFNAYQTDVRDERIYAEAYPSSLYTGESEFKNGTYDGLISDHAVRLEELEGKWRQDGFSGGSGKIGPDKAPDPISFSESSNIDWSTLGGTARLIPTYEWSSGPASGSVPSQRGMMAYAVDDENNRILLYGGSDGSNFSANEDSFQLSMANDNFGVLCNMCIPGPLANATLVWDRTTDRARLTGGTDDFGIISSVSYNYENSFWCATGNMPMPLTSHTEVLNLDDNTSIVFGGIDVIAGAVNRVYIRDGNNWNDRTSTFSGIAPSPRSEHTAVWDTIGSQMIVFGGLDKYGSPLNDLHTLKMGLNKWDKPAINGISPPVRYGHTAVWDPYGQAMIIHGGFDGSNVMSDTWIFWPSNNTWFRLPDSEVRYEHLAGWSEPKGAMFVWGGLKNEWTTKDSMLWKLKRNYKGLEGELLSTIFDAEKKVQVRHVEYHGRNIGGVIGTANLFIRVGNTPDPMDSTWSSWLGPFTEDDLDLKEKGVPIGQYIQYRFTLVGHDIFKSPEVDNVTIRFTFMKQAGEMMTKTFDLELVPHSFTGLRIEYKVEQGQGISIEVQTSNDQLDWHTYTYDDNESLATLDPTRFVRYSIRMNTNDTSVSPLLFGLELHYTFYTDWGFFVLKIDTMGLPLDSVSANWGGPESSEPGNVQRIEVLASNDDGVAWRMLNRGDPWNPTDSPMPPSRYLLINVTLSGDPKTEKFLEWITIKYSLLSSVKDVLIDVGADGNDDFTWLGVHSQGDSIEAKGMFNGFNQYIKAHKDEADPKGDVKVPVLVRAAGPCNVMLRDLVVNVQIDNLLPQIESEPSVHANVGYDYRYDIRVIDDDGDNVSLELIKAPDGMDLFNSDPPYIHWVPASDQIGKHVVRLTASDGKDQVFQEWTINVTDDKMNRPPYFTTEPPDLDEGKNTVFLEVGEEYAYRVGVADDDVSDTLKLTIESGPKDMTLDSVSSMLRWTPTEEQVGRHSVILRVTDTMASVTQIFQVEVAPLPNDPPQVKQNVPSSFNVRVGEEFKYKIDATDPNGDVLIFSLVGAPAWLTIDSTGHLSGKPGEKDVGSTDFTIVISDGKEELRPSTTMNVDERAAIGSLSFDDLLGVILLIVIIVIVVALVAYGVSRKRRKAGKADDISPGTDAPPAAAPTRPRAPPAQPRPPPTRAAARAGAGAASARPKAADAAATKAKTCEKPIIEEVYLMYNDGRLIAHETRRLRPDMDEMVMSGMLKAITDFVKDSFQREGSLGGLDYGEFRIMLETGKYAAIALVICGQETQALRDELRRTLEKIQGLYSGVIEDWDGDTKHFEDVKKYIQPLILMGRTLEEDAEMGDVRVMSALEFYQGYVRIKVAIKNNYPYMIHDVSLKTIYDKKALALSHIEPEYEMEGAEVMLGNISPKEKKTVAFYLDPLICMESNIDASVMYKSYKGEIKTAMMKRRPVDIVCPIFYTEQNVNVAMLKRLINELKYRDSKIYTIPKVLTPEKAMALAKETVQSHDVKFVREFTEDDPFIGEAWFYGKTKTTLEDLVIRATVRADSNTMELFVSSSNLATLPGLLADLAHGLKRRYSRQKSTKEDLSQVTDSKVKDSLEKSKLLIEKYATTEMEAESDELDM